MAYWVYANADKTKEGFNEKLEFELTLVPYKGNADWVEKTIESIKKCLDSEDLPKDSENCDYCKYREMVGKKLLVFKKTKSTQPVTQKTSSDATLGI